MTAAKGRAASRRHRIVRRLADVVPALLLGGAVAFVVAVMPVGLAERVVVLTRLPLVLAAAAPPLGERALMLLSGGLGIAAAVACFVALRLVDRLARARPAKPVAATPPPFAAAAAAPADPVPQPRRADRHPDAPARRPISAAHELGSVTLAEEPAAVAMPESAPEPVTASPASQPVAPPAAGDGSVSGLLARLERGLGTAEEEATPPRDAPPVSRPVPAHDALAAALESLSGIAAARAR